MFDASDSPVVGRFSRLALSLRRRAGVVLLVLGLPAAAVWLAGCATLQEVAALRQVDFSLAGVSEGTLAGIPLETVRSRGELSALSLARFGVALSEGVLPLQAVLQVRASNPEGNAQARLVALDWTLFLDDRETVSGSLDEERVLPPGDDVLVPVPVEVDLLDFFENRLEQVVDLALAVAGAGEPSRVRLEAIPTVQTPLGPMRYREPVRIEHEVGG